MIQMDELIQILLDSDLDHRSKLAIINAMRRNEEEMRDMDNFAAFELHGPAGQD